MGLALTLWSLVVSTRGRILLEVGRFRGFSTLALAGALRFLEEENWEEPTMHKQRPDVAYPELERAGGRILHSVDRFPHKEAYATVRRNNLTQYVQFHNADSRGLQVFPRAVWSL